MAEFLEDRRAEDPGAARLADISCVNLPTERAIEIPTPAACLGSESTSGQCVFLSENAVTIGQSLQVESLPALDPEHIYAMRLRAHPFQKLEASLSLNSRNAPVKHHAEGTSAAVSVLGYAMRVAGSNLLSSTDSIPSQNVRFTHEESSDSPQDNTADIRAVVKKMKQILETRRSLATTGSLNPSSLSEIEASLGRLEEALEGSVSMRQLDLNFHCFPYQASDNQYACTSPILNQLIEFDIHDRSTGEQTESIINLWMAIKAEPTEGSREFREAISKTVTEINDDLNGHPYRIPAWTSLQLQFWAVESRSQGSSNPSGVNDCESSRKLCIDIPGAFAVAQFGSVLRLPRRMGLSGALSAELDPATGGLRRIEVNGTGGGKAIAESLVEQLERDQELEALKRESDVLSAQKSICESTTALEVERPAFCPEP
ncbi:MAG: hypothetical protein GVY11_07225 [Gammaproteobacteria bacterium]|nr:hypothetical protein [Gammaproteobacteria bacterium]